MEAGVQKSDGSKISKKGVKIGGGVENNKRKRSRKEISLSSYESEIQKRKMRRRRRRMRNNGLDASGSKEKISGLTETLRCCTGLNVGETANSNGLGDNVVIPKRPRGTLKKIKPESANSSKQEKMVQTPSAVSTAKKKEKKTKENDSVKENSAVQVKGESGSSLGGTSGKNIAIVLKDDSLVLPKNNEAPFVEDDNDEYYGNVREVGHEYLEQNAARMLSSRFDPSFPGFSGTGMVPSSITADGSSGFQSMQRNVEGSRPESPSLDADGRVLRPRNRNGKSFARKRRHFYEVHFGDIDPNCILKQRIRVFWPLDKSWYFGLVKNYDPVTRLHHIKYDDRDEEWIDLRTERFKLLLFPSEVHTRFSSDKSLTKSDQSRTKLQEDEKRGGEKAVGNDCLDSYMESEPISSWLARSTHRGKSSTNVIKKRKRTPKEFGTSNLVEPMKSMALSPSCMISNKLFSKSFASEKLIDDDTSEIAVPKSRTNFVDRALSYVYFRKRFHSRNSGLESRDKLLEQHSACGHLAGSISILASVADRASAFEELKIITLPTELKRVSVMWSLFRPQCISAFAFGGERLCLSHTLMLLHYGKLVNLWPVVHMKIVLVDNAIGLRLLSLEGSLWTVISLVCMIITTFYKLKQQNKLAKLQMPFTSMDFKLSNLHNQGGQLQFVLYSFVKLESSKRRYLKSVLKEHCVTMTELPIRDFTYSNIESLPSRADMSFCDLVYKDAVPFEGFIETSQTEIVDQLVPHNSMYLTNPALCYVDQKYGRLPPSSLSSAASPSLLLSLHLKLLVDKKAGAVSFQNPNSSLESLDNSDKLNVEGCFPVEDHSDQASDITVENIGSSLDQVAANSGKPTSSSGVLSLGNDGGTWIRSSHVSMSPEVNVIGNSVGHNDLGMNECDETISQFKKSVCHTESWQGAEKSCSSFHEGSLSPNEFDGGCDSLNKTDVQAQSSGQMKEQSFDKRTHTAQSASVVGWEENEDAAHISAPAGTRSVWHQTRRTLVSSKFDHCPKVWPEDFMQNCFASGSKKPRSHVSYSLPCRGNEFGSTPRSHQRKARYFKKMKTDNPKRMSGSSERSQRYHKSLTCDANVLVTVGDRGWRECGAQVALDSDDHRGWRICVKFSEVTKYVHKPHHFLQPGTTNRYNHAMMWKGEKDWALEFTDRRNWYLFKEMHEECYNLNTRAAYVKNIPIPGVRMICDYVDDTIDVPFIRTSSKYYQHVGTEVDMALDPSLVLYDMDSGDEKWISEMRNSSDGKACEMSEITDDMFEMVMDLFEKYAFVQQCDEFTSDEIEEFMVDVGPLEMIKAIYEHWRLKRQQKGLPLIRQFQPALWECYQQQLQEWESAMSKMQTFPVGCQGKAIPIKKPPMFAFCLRPRGLEIQNKLLKQRSHKKFILPANRNAFAREKDGFRTLGGNWNRHSGGNEKTLIAVPGYDSFDSYHWLQSQSSFLPKDTARKGNLTAIYDASEGCHYQKLNRNNLKKREKFLSPWDSQMMPFTYNKNLKKNGVTRQSADLYELISKQQSQFDGLRDSADVNEFRLRDASSAAKHASNMAKLKREKAQWLLHKADVALHKATAALMIAEALKESEKDFLDDL